MTRPTRDYRDPLDVLLRAEEETCKGCKWREPIDQRTAHCNNPRQRNPMAEKRCEHYREAR